MSRLFWGRDCCSNEALSERPYKIGEVWLVYQEVGLCKCELLVPADLKVEGRIEGFSVEEATVRLHVRLSIGDELASAGADGTL